MAKTYISALLFAESPFYIAVNGLSLCNSENSSVAVGEDVNVRTVVGEGFTVGEFQPVIVLYVIICDMLIILGELVCALPEHIKCAFSVDNVRDIIRNGVAGFSKVYTHI